MLMILTIVRYSLCEQVFWTREGSEERAVCYHHVDFGITKSDAYEQVLSFPPAIAPTNVLLVPLSGNPEFKPLVANLTKVLRRQGLSTKVDDSGASIGKR